MSQCKPVNTPIERGEEKESNGDDTEYNLNEYQDNRGTFIFG